MTRTCPRCGSVAVLMPTERTRYTIKPQVSWWLPHRKCVNRACRLHFWSLFDCVVVWREEE